MNLFIPFLQLTEHLNDERDETIRFCFKDGSKGFIELNLHKTQEKSYTGWTVKSHRKPVRVSTLNTIIK